MSKRHRDKKDLEHDSKEQNKEIRKRKSMPGAPRTKERTSPGELHKVQ